MADIASDLVKLKIRQYFPDAEGGAIVEHLTSSGIVEERVQLAIIKLSEGNVEKLLELIDVAKIDWRDVLAWAEYPEEFAAATWNLETDDVTRIREEDRKQYKEWLLKD